MEKSAKVTAIIAIIICIVSLSWSVYFHNLFQREGKTRAEIDTRLKEAKSELGNLVERNTQLAMDLKEAKDIERRLVEEKEKAAEELAKAKVRIARLEGNMSGSFTEIVAIDKAPTRLEKVSSSEEDIEAELQKIRSEKQRLQLVLQERTGTTSGTTETGTSASSGFSGRVLVVNEKYDFVVIDIGEDHGMETGSVLILHRGTRFLGKVTVEKVYARMSAATLLLDWLQDEPKVGDGARMF